MTHCFGRQLKNVSNTPSLSTMGKSTAILVKKIESQLSEVIRSSLTSCFEALKTPWFLKLKSLFMKLRGEMLKFSKSSAYFDKFVHTLVNKTVNRRIHIQLSSLRSVMYAFTDFNCGIAKIRVRSISSIPDQCIVILETFS